MVQYLIFVSDTVHPERLTTSGITDTNRKELKDFFDSLKDLEYQLKKITPEIEDTILNLRLTKRFGCNRIKFRLKRIIGISLSTRTIYKILKRHCLNILKCQTKVRRYKRFAMKHPNDMVQLDILGILLVIPVKGITSSAVWMIVLGRYNQLR